MIWNTNNNLETRLYNKGAVFLLEVKSYVVLPLEEVVVFPHTLLRLDFMQNKVERDVEDAMTRGEQVLIVGYRKEADESAGQVDTGKLALVGTICRVKQIMRLPGGQKQVVLEGQQRGLVQIYQPNGEEALRAQATEQVDLDSPDEKSTLLVERITERLRQLIRLNQKYPASLLREAGMMQTPGLFADFLATHLQFSFPEKQVMLADLSVEQRLLDLSVFIEKVIQRHELENYIQSQTQTVMAKSQREYFLREQMKVIQKELGEAEEKQAEKERMSAMLEAIQGISADNKDKLSKEINRLEKMPASTPEAAVLRQYLDTVFQLPWDTVTEDVLDIKAAETVLNEDHYALEKPKERILEYLAVRQLSHSLKGPIICLVGPPGTGKTSLAKSVARALNRKFIRLSLGGVRDEAEIRGHRRTYVASMPGRIIQGIRQVGVRNPVFLLDEVDKTSSDYRGDPAAALLEVLDSEQNNTFSDHYLEIPFDLSQVLFITTANNAREIPRPLLDRMELIELSSYTEEEKFEIAKRHLIPKQLHENGLREDQLQFADKTVTRMISAYTRESGVRQLERQIGKICRKRARQILSGEESKLNLTANKLDKYLGTAVYSHTAAEKQDQIGVATGVVWTEMGGEILPIEVSILEGKGDLILTGKLGEVMRESARIALSYVRSKGEAYGLMPEFYKEKDIHIHAPEGSVPKEGPSAGVTLVTALVSAYTKYPVRRDVAMTGEITLRGNILPIGGLKEKLLAAYRAGIYEAVIPEENRKDMEELPESIQRKMTIHYAENYEQALGHLIPELERRIKQMKREKKED